MPRVRPVRSRPLTWADLAELGSDVGPGPRVVGAVVHLARPVPVSDLLTRVASRAADDDALASALGRQLVRPPWRRPRWATTGLDVTRQCGVLLVESEHDDDATVRAVTAPLPDDRPLWRLDLIAATDRPAETSTLVFRAHHALLDGPTAIDALQRLLADEPSVAPTPTPTSTPAPTSTPTPAAPDPRTPRPGGRTFPGIGVAASWSRASPATSLLRPIGPRTALVTVTTDLPALRRRARVAGATVNDALLAVLTRTVTALAADRGERLPHVTVSVPVTRGGDGRRRNSVGQLRLAVPAPRPGESVTQHLGRIARRTRWRKSLLGDDSAARLAAPGLALAGAVGLMGPYLRRQRTITTLLTNLRGPERLDVLGTPVTQVVPLTPAVGNLPVIAAALSQGDSIGLTLRVDTDALDPVRVRGAAEAALAVVLGE